MKKVFFLSCMLTSTTLFAQKKTIQLTECIRLALANKANVSSVRTGAVVANLQELEARNKYIPQISIAYEYRYYPIIPRQVIPVGQFNAVPTDEFRAIKFGTNWQQSAGVNITQALVDFSIRGKLAESRINQKIKQADVRAAEDDLKYEVVTSFGKILSNTQKLESAAVDTTRTYRSYQLIEAKFEERRVLKSDVNKALLNHNNAISSYKTAVSDLIREKIYLSFLTSLPVSDLLDAEFDFAPFYTIESFYKLDRVQVNELASIQQLDLQRQLYTAQIKTERQKLRPTLNFIGYLGANQYTNDFAPFMENSWFGNSYVGISLKMPLTGENIRSKVGQLQSQIQGVSYDRSEEENKRTKDFLQALEDVKRDKDQIALTQRNVGLMTENVTIFQARLDEGQYNASDLNIQELDLLKEKSSLQQYQAELILRQVDCLNASGYLGAFTAALPSK